MAFWGVELKPGEPHSHRFDRSRGRLHVSQATLGVGTSRKKSLVQCTVGEKSPILLCSLIPDKAETCPLDFEFEEDEEVVFSVVGPQSVHLGGYYLDKVADFEGDSDDSDSYGVDIGESDSEQSTDFDTEDEYDDDFIVDDDVEMFSPSHRPNSGVVIEEILDDEKTANGNDDCKSLKNKVNKHQVSDSDGDDQKQIVVNGHSSEFSESEDEDGFPVSSLSKSKDGSAEVAEKPDKKVSKQSNKKAEDGGDQVASAKKKKGKRKNPDSETEREVEKLNDSSLPSLESGQENLEKPKKKKKKERTKEGKTLGAGDDKENEALLKVVKTNGITQEESLNNDADEPSNDKIIETDTNTVAEEDSAGKKKKKKKNKKNKTPESDVNANTPEAKKASVHKIEDKEAEVKPTKERSYPNGLVVEELEMGKPNGKRASPGNKVSLHYIGKLKKNGKIFDSNIRGANAPFTFRLGVGQVIKGWDVAVNGMRVGDKRRLTIPPSMGYGAQGYSPQIPPNSWLVFDVELVAVR